MPISRRHGLWTAPGAYINDVQFFQVIFVLITSPPPLPPGSDRPDIANLSCMYKKKSALLISRLSDSEINVCQMD